MVQKDLKVFHEGGYTNYKRAYSRYDDLAFANARETAEAQTSA